MRTRSPFYILSIFIALALLFGAVLPAAADGKPASVDVQVLAVNDFHGALLPSTVKIAGTKPAQAYIAGGAAYLAARLAAAELENPNTVKVSAGDMIGASPLLSALFHDEPTIQAFNLMGFDLSAVGNHEFDEGWHELLRMQNGGCHPIDGCYADVPEFTGADFHYLTANVVRLDNGQTLFPAFEVKEFGGVKVAFIGVSLQGTPSIVVPSGVAGLAFGPEVEAINSTVQYLKDSEGIKAFVVLLHDGAGSAANQNACNSTDPFYANVVMQLSPEVDVLITGHSHNAYKCAVTVKKNYGPMLVTSAGSSGRYYTDVDLTINGTNGQVASATAQNIEVVDGPIATAPNNTDPAVPVITADADPDVQALIDAYNAIAGPIANRVVGSITADITRVQNAAGESALGDVLADAQLAATAAAADGGAVVAMTNPGGIRNELYYAPSVGEGNGNVTYGEAFAVQPFSNSLVTMTLTGAQLKAVLEQQAVTKRVLQISYSLTYTWTASAPAGSQVTNLKINGVDVDPNASYRVTVNNFLAGGGDGFTTLLAGTDLLTGEIDLDAFVAYLETHSPIAPGPQNRITLVP